MPGHHHHHGGGASAVALQNALQMAQDGAELDTLFILKMSGRRLTS